MLVLRAISSSSKSVTVVPSSTLPNRGTAPAQKSNDETSEVLPVSPWPITPRFRISSVS